MHSPSTQGVTFAWASIPAPAASDRHWQLAAQLLWRDSARRYPAPLRGWRNSNPEPTPVKLAVGEAERNRLHSGYGWRMHTLKATAVDLGRPILFSKAIIILAFLPIFTFQRVEGKIFSPMAYTISFALLGAILLTLTLVPTLLSYTLHKGDLAEKHSAWMHSLQEWYRRVLLRAEARRKSVVVVCVGMLAAALLLAPKLGSEFLPKLDEGNIWEALADPATDGLGNVMWIVDFNRQSLDRVIPGVRISQWEVEQEVATTVKPVDSCHSV